MMHPPESGISLLASCAVGLMAGLHAATWGMYKDAPHEGFTWRTYFRSVAVALIAAVGIHHHAGLRATGAAGIVVMFGVVYAVERALAEIYKSFLREEDQSKYTIPMQLAVGGRIVKSRFVRYVVAALYAGGIVLAILVLPRLVTIPGGTAGILVLVAVGSIGGWISAFGGAWKDAPIEGFQIFKFFRSPLISAAWALLLTFLTRDLLAVGLGAIGYTIATIETYKTFFFPSVPRGKFADKPVLFPDMLRRRQYFVPLYATIWLIVIVSFAIAIATRGADA